MKKLLCASLLVLMASNPVIADVSQPNDKNIFPDVKSSYLKQPMRIDVEQASKIDLGLNKDTVRKLLLNPHFKEFGGKIWNYWLSIQIPNTHDYVECQLRLDFDDKVLVKQIRWSSEQCATLVNTISTPAPQTVVVPTAVVVAPSIPSTKTIVLPSDALFRFNGSGENDISPKGRADLISLVESLKGNVDNIKGISILGYADRIGSSQYNLNLSQQRAATIKRVLLNNGLNISPEKITATGLGISNMTTCASNLSKTALISCLSPDRRIEIQIKN